MELIWGLVIIALGLLAWIGQAISRFAPATAVRLSLMEAEDTVDAVYWADIRAEALWDTFMLWTLPLAGLLLVAGLDAWTWFGLFGGGIYLYFGGRGLFTRLEIRGHGHRIGEPSNVRLGLLMCLVWGAAGLITALVAVAALA
ncbi:MAG: hypothetical protein PVG27_06645 [Chloroflexota bacterium]